MCSNPNGAATMPLHHAAEQAVQPVTGGIEAWLSSSDPMERYAV